MNTVWWEADVMKDSIQCCVLLLWWKKKHLEFVAGVLFLFDALLDSVKLWMNCKHLRFSVFIRWRHVRNCRVASIYVNAIDSWLFREGQISTTAPCDSVLRVEGALERFLWMNNLNKQGHYIVHLNSILLWTFWAFYFDKHEGQRRSVRFVFKVKLLWMAESVGNTFCFEGRNSFQLVLITCSPLQSCCLTDGGD